MTREPYTNMNDLSQRINVLDLLIEVLAGHEKELDDLADRLEKAVTVIERVWSY